MKKQCCPACAAKSEAQNNRRKQPNYKRRKV